LVLGAAGLAGFIDSMVGGGGLIQLPALLSGYPAALPATLLGTNKLASILGTGSAVARYARSVRIPWRALAPAVAVALPAALLGASLVTLVAPTRFRALVPLVLIAVLVYVLRKKDLGARHVPALLTRRRHGFALVGIALIGLYDGFFGPGTGSFLMLLYMRVYGFDYVHASASARLINVATNAGALLCFGLHGTVDWALAFALGGCNVAGSVVGAGVALKHGSRLVRVIFIVVVTALIVKTARDAYG
jgi:uncharacterized membrane protein YfcA